MSQINEQQLIQLAQREEQVLQQQTQFLHNLKSALKETHDTIESLKAIQTNKETIQIKIGPSIYVEASIKNNEECLRMFAENGFKKTSVKESIEWLEKRKNNLERQAEKIQSDVFSTEQKLINLINTIKQVQIDKSKNISVK